MVFVYPKSLCCLEYLDLGHVKSICLNFGIARASERENRECRAICWRLWHQAKKFGGSCNLRFDDTNPESEKQAVSSARHHWGFHPKTKKTKNDATCQFFWFVLLFQVFIDSIQEDVRQDILWTCSMITSWVFQCFLSGTYSASGFCLWMKGGLALSGTVQSLSSSWFGVKLHGWITF